MRIQNNIPALNTFRQMGVNNTGSAKSLEKLSSGFRINRAGDDAAGLAISEKMRAQIRGLNRASSNAQDGISLIQSAEGALQETHSILQRMRELAVQAANDTNEAIDRQAIQDEINQLTKEIDRIAFTTEFNKKVLLDGSLADGKFIKTVSGSGLSGLTIVPPSATDEVVINALTTVAVTQAGEKANVTFDFKFKEAAEMTGGEIVGAKTQRQGNIEITLGTAIQKSLGLTDEQCALTVAVEIGDTADVVSGKVRDMLQTALGEDWDVLASDTRVTVTHKFIGDFSAEDASDGTGAIDDFIHIASIMDDDIFVDGDFSGDAAQGTVGKDALVQVNGGDVDFTQVNTNSFTFSDVAESGYLKGRDALKQLALYDGTNSADEGERAQFLFKLDDPSKMSNAIVSINDGNDLALQIGANTGYTQTIQLAVKAQSAAQLGVAELKVSNHDRSQNAIAATEYAITMVSTQRAGLGAVQNRLEHTIANLDTVAENLQDAESRIRDTDMAKEMMNFTKFNILLQASQAMMAQANSLPQGVLQLLR